MSGRRSSNLPLLLGHGLPARKVSAMYKRGEDLRAVVGGRDLLIVKADRQKPLVALRMSLATEIAKGTA
jgi:hypothetical protein